MIRKERMDRLSRARVLLADDNAVVADQIRELLAETFEVVGVVGSGEDLETAFEALAPEVVVTDVVMPGEGGLLAAQRILQRYPGTPIVLMSVLGEPPLIRASLASGVLGYVVKHDAAAELVPAVLTALDGGSYVSATGRVAAAPD
jgi:DNA-binding NarL/FixJ family response regulator